MSRAKWKGPFINPNFTNLRQISIDKKISIYTISKDSDILPRFVGLQFMVYNGQKYVNILVYETMVGHKFGEFITTRARFTFKKKASK